MSVASAGFPYVHVGPLHVGIPIQPFGIIVAVRVLVGASLGPDAMYLGIASAPNET